LQTANKFDFENNSVHTVLQKLTLFNMLCC